MAGITSVDLARRVGENLESARPDLLREFVILRNARTAVACSNVSALLG